jgi:hypothetical protein
MGGDEEGKEGKVKKRSGIMCVPSEAVYVVDGYTCDTRPTTSRSDVRISHSKGKGGREDGWIDGYEDLRRHDW